jgi:HK97 family phage major capsid protein
LDPRKFVDQLIVALATLLGIPVVIGYRRDGRPITAMAGADGTEMATDVAEQIGTLTQQLKDAIKVMGESKATDGARWEEADKARETIVGQLTTLTETQQKQEREAATVKAAADVEAFLASVRRPSKAGLAGGSPTDYGLMAESGKYFFAALAKARSRDADEQRVGKQILAEMGSEFADIPAEAKATLGDTNAAGGFLVPANLVTAINETATAGNPYRQLLNVIPDVRGTGVEIPNEGPAPTRAAVVGRGVTKPNVNLSVDRYTATLYTIAVIYDVGNQLLRQSQGAVERLVRSKLSRSFALGESFYIIQGSGSNEPKGILTSLNAGPAIYRTTRTGSANTVAGSIVKAIAQAAGALAGRDRQPDGAVLNAVDWWSMAAEGTDSAGFFFAPAQGPTGVDLTRGEMRIWGIRTLADSNMPADNAVVGAFSDAELYLGHGYRVDVSTEAGDRWDKNLTGFRGEEEIGFNADPYVFSGLFQKIVDVAA